MPNLTPEEQDAVIAQYYGGMQSPAAPIRDMGELPGVLNAPRDLGELPGPPVNAIRDMGELPGPPVNAAVDMGDVDVRDMGELPGINQSLAGMRAQGAGAVRYPGDPASLAGGFKQAFSNTDPLVQNPLAPPVRDMGELPGPPVGSVREPVSFARGPVNMGELPGPPVGEQKIAAYYGGGGGKPANPDPYGILAAQQGELDALGHKSDAMRRAADADAVRASQIAEGTRDLARMQQEDAAIARAEADAAQKNFSEGMQQIARELDDVRAKKIDPLRTMKESPALAVTAVVGGLLGGFYQGITGGAENQFLKDLDRQIDRGIAADEQEIASKKFALGEAGNLLQQARASQKDNDVAKLQARNLVYEAVKQDIIAKADDPAINRAHADEGIAMVEFQQKELRRQIAEARARLAAQAGAAATAQAKEVRDFRFKVYEGMIKEGYSPAQAEEEARRQVGVQYLGGMGPRPAEPVGTGLPLGKAGREEIAKEAHKASTEVAGLIDTFKSYDPKKVAAGGTIAAQLPNALRTEGMRAEADERERYNSDVRASVGAAWRLKTHGMEPKNPTLLEEQAHAFLAVPTDGPADIARKRANMIEHLTNAARSSGVDAPKKQQLDLRPVK